MPITGSTIFDDSRQSDGRRRIDERHIDQFARVHSVSYLCEANFNAQAAMVARASQISARLKADEFLIFTDRATPVTYVPTESTDAELLAYIREAYRVSSREDSVTISSLLRAWIDTGRFSDMQARTAFGMSVGSWTTLRIKMNGYADTRAAVASAAGE